MAEDGDVQYDPEKNYDEATMAQEKQIEKEIADQQQLINPREDFTGLQKEYVSDDVYLQKIEDLKSKYCNLRRTRGDGNCFYRAFGFAYLEKCLRDTTESKRFKEYAAKSKDDLVALGFPQFTIEDFHEVFMEVVGKVCDQCSVEELLEIFNDQGYSDYLVVYFRLLVSGFLQKEEEFYQNFIEGGRTVKEFCNQEVEPMGKESDHIHITALTSTTGIPVRVMYMDRGDGGTLNAHDFPEGSKPAVHLLYRPSHYDILYQ